MLTSRHILLLLLPLACRRETPLAEEPRAAATVGPGTALIVEKRASVVRYLESERIPFDDLWNPPASGVAFLDAAVLRFLDTHPSEPLGDPELELQYQRELSALRENLGSYVRECAGLISAGRRRVACEFVLRYPGLGWVPMSEARSFTAAADGGCEVFYIVADIERRELLSFSCNGSG
jgi:hypothetical protein